MGVFKRHIKSKNGTKSAYWYIRYTAEGRDKWESVGKVGEVTKGIAQAMLDKRKRQVKRGELDEIDAEIPTLQEFSNEYLTYIKYVKRNRSWKSSILHLKKLNEYFEHRKLSQITVKDIDDFKLIRLRDVKPSSLNRELATLSHLFNYAKRQKRYFGENPVSISKLLPEHNQVERTLTLEEEERLLNNCPNYLRVIVVCALNTGMRIGEIISLKWNNVDLDNNVITLEHTNTKNKKSRRIPTNSYLRNLLIEQKLKVGNADHVFLNSKGVPYKRYDSLNQAFRRAKKMAGIENLRFHDLRHSAATRMAESGVSIIAINKILGHADLKTTMRYAHPDDSLKDAVEILGNFNNKCSNFCSNEKSG